MRWTSCESSPVLFMVIVGQKPYPIATYLKSVLLRLMTNPAPCHCKRSFSGPKPSLCAFGSSYQVLEQYTNASDGLQNRKVRFLLHPTLISLLTYDIPRLIARATAPSYPTFHACILPRPLLEPQPSSTSRISPPLRVPPL